MSRPINIGPDFEGPDEDTDRELVQIVEELEVPVQRLAESAARALQNRGFSQDEVRRVRNVEEDVVKAGRFAWDLFSELFDKEG